MHSQIIYNFIKQNKSNNKEPEFRFYPLFFLIRRKYSKEVKKNPRIKMIQE